MSNMPPVKELFIDHAEVTKYQNERGLEALEILTETLGEFAIERVDSPDKADAMVVLGGDGTFLHSMREHDFPNIPIAGVNTGTMGYLMDTLPGEDDLRQMLRCMSVGNWMVKSLPLLEVPVGNEGDTVLAMNDVVVGSVDRTQAFKASLRLGEKGMFDHFVGDGFIFATPQGSTSYSYSAGGPILHEDLHAYVVTPSNPHGTKHYYSLPRSVVVDGRVEAVVQAKELEKRPLMVNADKLSLDEWFQDGDGQVSVGLSDSRKLGIVRFSEYDYFSHISDAFGGKQAVEE